MLHSSIQKGQMWIIERMEALKYPIKRKGACFGVSHMAVQAILANDLDTYNARLEMLNTISAHQLNEAINSVYKKISALRKTNDREMKNNKDVEELLSEQKRLLISIPPFLQGVSLYQVPYESPDFFEADKIPKGQSASSTEPLTRPQELDKIEKITTLSHAHNAQSLEKYFNHLKMDLMKCDFPVAFTIESIDHAIAVGYDKKRNQWSFTDANQLPTKYFSNQTELAESVINSLSINSISAFEMKVYCESKNSEKLSPLVRKWKAEQLLEASEQKTKLTDSNGSTWLTFAVCHHDYELIKTLLSKGANPNLMDMENNTPFLIAYKANHIKILKMLLPYADNTFDSQNHGDTRFTLAVKYNLPDVLDEFIKEEKSSYIDKPDKDGNTPLRLAIKSGKVELVKLLLKSSRVDVNERNAKGSTLLDMEMVKSNFTMVKLLAQHPNIKLNSLSRDGKTPLYLAIQRNDINVITILLQHGAKINIENLDGETPLHAAVSSINIKLVRMLLMSAGFNPDSDAGGLSLIRRVMQMLPNEITGFVRNKQPLAYSNAKEVESVINENELARVRNHADANNKIAVWKSFIEMINHPDNQDTYIIDIYSEWKNLRAVPGVNNIDVIQPGEVTTSRLFQQPKEESYLFLEELLNIYGDKKPADFPSFSQDVCKRIFENAFVEKMAERVCASDEEKQKFIKQWGKESTKPLAHLVCVHVREDELRVKECVAELLTDFRNCDAEYLKASLHASSLLKFVNELKPNMSQSKKIKSK